MRKSPFDHGVVRGQATAQPFTKSGDGCDMHKKTLMLSPNSARVIQPSEKRRHRHRANYLRFDPMPVPAKSSTGKDSKLIIETPYARAVRRMELAAAAARVIARTKKCLRSFIDEQIEQAVDRQLELPFMSEDEDATADEVPATEKTSTTSDERE